MAESGNQALKLQRIRILFAAVCRERVRAMLQNPRILAGINGKAMTAVAQVELAPVNAKDELQFPALQDHAVMIVQNRNQHFSVELGFDRIPVNIEKARVDGGFAVLKNVEPPCVVIPHDAHVIGHDVEYQSHAMFVKSCDKTIVLFRAPDFRIERVMVDDVVPMHTASASL